MHQVGDGDIVELGSLKAKVYDTPGHTLGHIVFHFEEQKMAFVGKLSCTPLPGGPCLTDDAFLSVTLLQEIHSLR